MFDIVYSFLSFTLYLLLCCTVLGLVSYYLPIQPLATRVFYLLNHIKAQRGQICTSGRLKRTARDRKDGKVRHFRSRTFIDGP